MIARTELSGFARTSAPLTRMSETEEAAQEQGETSTDTIAPSETSEFEGSLQAYLATFAGQEVSEEELFAGVIREQLTSHKGEEVATQYATYFAEESANAQKPNGYIGYEDAAKNALRTLVEEGSVSAEEGDTIYSESFSAAQLDNNSDALFDDRGGANDPTIAIETLENATTSATTAIAAYSAGQSAPARSLSEATPGKAAFTNSSSTTATSGSSASSASVNHGSESTSEQFLFKPVSETTGNIVVLTPASWAGEIDSLSLLNTEGEVIEEGEHAGNANGGRDHFRFDQPGSAYPAGLTVEVRLNDGTIKTFTIDDPSERYEK
jgi:hypothetical protein